MVLTAYGDEGNSGPIVLGEAGKGLFQVGNQDQFKVNFHVGKLYKIRVELLAAEGGKELHWKLKDVSLVTLKLYCN